VSGPLQGFVDKAVYKQNIYIPSGIGTNGPSVGGPDRWVTVMDWNAK